MYGQQELGEVGIGSEPERRREVHGAADVLELHVGGPQPLPLVVDLDVGFVTADGGIDDRFVMQLGAFPALSHEPVPTWGGTFESPVPGAPLEIYADLGQDGDRFGSIQVVADPAAPLVVARWGELF